MDIFFSHAIDTEEQAGHLVMLDLLVLQGSALRQSALGVYPKTGTTAVSQWESDFCREGSVSGL